MTRLHVVLYRPSIAGNVGCIVRTCEGFGAHVHIIGSHLRLDAACTNNELNGKAAAPAGGSRADTTAATRAAVGLLRPRPSRTGGAGTRRGGSNNDGDGDGHGPTAEPAPLLQYTDAQDFLVRGPRRHVGDGASTALTPPPPPLFLISKAGRLGSTSLMEWRLPWNEATRSVSAEVWFMFGNESTGLTGLRDAGAAGAALLENPAVAIPMAPQLRSYNLACAVSMVLWEAARQVHVSTRAPKLR